jgi:TatA/E family protein of Tat protein translocase
MLSVPHLIIIFVVALIVFGPQKLPELARNLGKIMAEFRKATGDLRSTFDEHMRELERESQRIEQEKHDLQIREAALRAAQAAAALPAAGASGASALAEVGSGDPMPEGASALADVGSSSVTLTPEEADGGAESRASAAANSDSTAVSDSGSGSDSASSSDSASGDSFPSRAEAPTHDAPAPPAESVPRSRAISNPSSDVH